MTGHGMVWVTAMEPGWRDEMKEFGFGVTMKAISGGRTGESFYEFVTATDSQKAISKVRSHLVRLVGGKVSVKSCNRVELPE